MSNRKEPEPLPREWSKQELTEQAVAQESATEALADEMMRIRKDLAKVLEHDKTVKGEIIKNHKDILLLRDSLKELTVICVEIDKRLKEMEKKELV